MKIIEQSIELMEGIDGEAILWKIEAAARNCYKSEDKNAERDIEKRNRLISHAVGRGHTSVLEHGNISFRVICNRGVSHEWVRHRIGWSYSQESTRYCNYGHSEGITVIWPTHKLGAYKTEAHLLAQGQILDRIIWVDAMKSMESYYLRLLARGWKPEDARDPLGIALKTEIVCTANVVALRHFFKLRCAKAAHPQIRALALMLLERLMWTGLDILFQDLIDEHLMGKNTKGETT